MKEVRYHDRLWFGKHKGNRISDIIRSDPNFIRKLMNEKKIKLDKKCYSIFEGNERQVHSSRPWGNPHEAEAIIGRPRRKKVVRKLYALDSPISLEKQIKDMVTDCMETDAIDNISKILVNNLHRELGEINYAIIMDLECYLPIENNEDIQLIVRNREYNIIALCIL